MRYFLMVAQEGTISRAAEKLCMAQPPLSRQLQQLEEELGVCLFIRGKRQIRLTAEGEFLKQQAEEIIALLEKTENQLMKTQSSTHGTVMLGVTESCGASVLSGLIDAFHKKYPHVRYNIWCGNGDETNERIDKGLVDIGIVREPFDTEKYESIFLKTEAWIALLGRQHPLSSEPEETIELSRLAREPLIIPSRLTVQNEISNWFSMAAGEQNILCLYNTLSCVVPLVSNNLAIAICPESVRYFTDSQKLVYKKIINPEHLSRIMAVRQRHRIMSTAAGRLWDFIREGG